MGRYATPLRYPGGKQRLAPFILEILEANLLCGGEYVEPYAGGAGVAIELLLSRSVSRIHLNDCSLPVFAFWSSVINDPEGFCRRIASASLTVQEWRRCQEILRSAGSADLLDLGYATFFLNRCNRSGVLTGGLIGGIKQEGNWLMDARFNRNELIRRIERIADFGHLIDVYNLDAEDFLESNRSAWPDNTLVYCDPPYFERAKGLYLNKYIADDHTRFAEFIQSQTQLRWIVSYDGVPEIEKLYTDRRTILYDLQYSAARPYKGKEFFIFSDEMCIPMFSKLPYIQVALSAISDREPLKTGRS